MSVQEPIISSQDEPIRNVPVTSVAGQQARDAAAFRRSMFALRGHRQSVATLALALMALIGGTVMALTVESLFPIMLTLSGILDTVSIVTAAVGTLGILCLVLLAAQIPALDRAFGRDGLIAWHKVLGPWSLVLIAVHIAASVLSVAAAATDNRLRAAISFVVSDGDLVLALLGSLIFLVGGVTSWSKVRGLLPRGLWWTVHLTLYLGILLAFFHQVTAGGPFMIGVAKALWIGVYVVVGVLVLTYRVALPLIRSAEHGLRVEAVVYESPGVYSVWMRGRGLDALGMEPGQFMSFRFLSPGLVWQAHPYSLSALPGGDLIRITVAEVGTGTARLRHVRPGTRVLVEGPHGVLTPVQFGSERVVLFGGGVGIAPLVPLARTFAGRGVPVDVVYRTSVHDRAPLLHELTDLHDAGWIRLMFLPGHRHEQPLDSWRLHTLLGDVRNAEIYMCGPVGLTDEIQAGLRALGATPDRIHTELFEM
ncbi:ferredoxin reductase family protein [Kocuria soli]|nr:ferredoxin reductase family protein [Kocuria soli]